MTILTSLTGLEGFASSRSAHGKCYRACDIAPVLGVIDALPAGTPSMQMELFGHA